jgi:putative ABC transport system permease protein
VAALFPNNFSLLKIGFLRRFIAADLLNSWRRFVFVILAFSLGIGLLVAVSGLSASLKATINTEAKSLLAADISVSSQQELPNEALAEVSPKVRTAREITFASMLAVPNNNKSSRLIQVRAIEGAYPFYGIPEIDPKDSLEQVTQSHNNASSNDTPAALVDAVVAQQFAIKRGDLIKLGRSEYRISGIIKSFPGESYARTVIAPKVFVPLHTLANTELLQRGSRVTYKYYFAFDDEADLKNSLNTLKDKQAEYRYEIETVESRKKNIERVLNNVSRFLVLISLVALLLGAIGVASAMNTYIRARFQTIAMLRCIGATSNQILLVYILEGLIVATLGTFIGSVSGLGVQRLLPFVLGEFFPLQISASASLGSLAQAVLAALVISIFVCIVPLLRVIGMSPLQAIRNDSDFKPISNYSHQRSFILISIGLLFVCAVTVLLSGSIKHGIIFALALFLLVTILLTLSTLLVCLLKMLRPNSGGFGLRYGMASMHRPFNQTNVLILTLGLAAFLFSVIYLSRAVLLSQLTLAGAETRPNLILFDVQTDQLEQVRSMTQEAGLSISQEVPIVTMRLASINGVDNFVLRADADIPEWTLRREYRSSFRSSLIESETLLSGQLTSVFDGDLNTEYVPVSVEDGIAKNLKLKLGDKLIFDVQGVEIKSIITSIRRVDWRRIQTNFFFLFPLGVLESAPQFYALMTHSPSLETTANLQQRLVDRFGNISAIDLNLIFETADQILEKISAAVKFLALITFLAGLLVLSGAIATTRGSRLREILLLRTVGATTAQLLKATLVEFLLLGLSASCVGVAAGVAAAWGISLFYFESAFVITLLPLAMIIVGMTLLVLAVGILSTIGLFTSQSNCSFTIRGIELIYILNLILKSKIYNLFLPITLYLNYSLILLYIVSSPTTYFRL